MYRDPQEDERKKWHTENLKRVNAAIHAEESSCIHLASLSGPHPGGGYLDFFSVNGNVLILQTYANYSGFEVWTPLTTSQNMDEVIAKLHEYVVGTLHREPIKR